MEEYKVFLINPEQQKIGHVLNNKKQKEQPY